MIRDIIERIEQKGNIESVALNYHNPGNGVYVIVDKDFNYKVISRDRFSFNSKYVCMDFYSQLISVNKAVDKKKQVLSNNYFSFFCKNLDKVVGDPKIIDGYYSSFGSNTEKYSEWIKANLAELKQYADKKYPLKIFFLAKVEEYVEEAKKYLNDNVLSNPTDDEMGVSVFLSTNYKKPYLKNFTRKESIPERVNLIEATKYYYLMRLLSSMVEKGNDILYIFETGDLLPLNTKKGEMPVRDFINAILVSYKFNNRGALILTDIDIIPKYSNAL